MCYSTRKEVIEHVFHRDRQKRWDERGLVTVSTHLTRREYEIMKAVLAMTGQTMYGALQDALRESVRRAEVALQSEMQEQKPAEKEKPRFYSSW